MSFPRTPVDGQTTVTNNIVYQYTLDTRSWRRVFGTIAVSSTTVTTTDQSISTATGALIVPGGVSIGKNLYAAGTVATKGWSLYTATYVVFNTGTTVFSTASLTTNLLGGGAGSLPIQSGSGKTTQIPIGSAGSLLTVNNASSASWVSTGTMGIGQDLSLPARFSTTANNLKGYSWDTSTYPRGAIPYQVSGSRAVNANPGTSFPPVITEYSQFGQTSTGVLAFAINPINPNSGNMITLPLSNYLSGGPAGPTGATAGPAGPTGRTGPAGFAGPDAFRLFYQFPNQSPANPSVAILDLYAYSTSYAVWQMPDSQGIYTFQYIIVQNGQYSSGNMYSLAGSPSFPFIVGFKTAFNSTPWAIIIGQADADGGNSTSHVPIWIYVTSLGNGGFQVSAVRKDTGAAFTGKLYGWFTWWAIGK